jgi:hypothetical protein
MRSAIALIVVKKIPLLLYDNGSKADHLEAIEKQIVDLAKLL